MLIADKKRALILFLKTLLFAVIGITAVVSNAAVWDAFIAGCSSVDVFILILSILNFLIEIAALGYFGVRIIFPEFIDPSKRKSIL